MVDKKYITALNGRFQHKFNYFLFSQNFENSSSSLYGKNSKNSDSKITKIKPQSSTCKCTSCHRCCAFNNYISLQLPKSSELKIPMQKVQFLKINKSFGTCVQKPAQILLYIQGLGITIMYQREQIGFGKLQLLSSLIQFHKELKHLQNT